MCGWWPTKPEYSDISKCFFYSDKQKEIADILDGKEIRIGGTDYRLKEISEGKIQEIESE